MKPWDGRLGGESALSYLHHDDQADFFDYVGSQHSNSKRHASYMPMYQHALMWFAKEPRTLCREDLRCYSSNPTIQYSRQTICLMILNLIRDGFMYEPGDYMIKKYVEEIWAKHMTHTQ